MMLEQVLLRQVLGEGVGVREGPEKFLFISLRLFN